MPFEKGKSGNPSGRPKKKQCIPDILRKIGAEEIETKGGRMTKIEALMHMVYKRAVEGDQWAVNFIADRTEGKPVIKVEGDNDKEIIIRKHIIHDVKDAKLIEANQEQKQNET